MTALVIAACAVVYVAIGFVSSLVIHRQTYASPDGLLLAGVFWPVALPLALVGWGIDAAWGRVNRALDTRAARRKLAKATVVDR